MRAFADQTRFSSVLDFLTRCDFTGLIPTWKADSFWLADHTSRNQLAIAVRNDSLSVHGYNSTPLTIHELVNLVR